MLIGLNKSLAGGMAAALCLLAGCATNSGTGGKYREPSVFVAAEHPEVRCVAVMPFQAEMQLIGASISDMFVTEMMRFGRYEFIERGQLDNVLGETEISLSGLTSGQAAQVGQMLGADAVVVGTVSEYGTVAQRGHTLPVAGINVRMIESNSGRILWSVDNAARGDRRSTLAQHARSVVKSMTDALYQQLK